MRKLAIRLMTTAATQNSQLLKRTSPDMPATCSRLAPYRKTSPADVATALRKRWLSTMLPNKTMSVTPVW